MDSVSCLEKIESRLAAHGSEGAAVLIPLIPSEEGDLSVLLEVRSATLDIQPSEVCLPGGHIERGETPLEACIRECAEELLVSACDIHVLGDLGPTVGPGGMTLWAFVGTIDGYTGTFSPDEVERVFTIPLEWLLEHPAKLFEVQLTPSWPDDFPWELVPGGRGYPWRQQRNVIPFYPGTEPCVWGATARVLERFAQILRPRR